MQLDLFLHSHDTMLRNDVLEALLRHDEAAARAAHRALAEQAPLDVALAPLGTLIDAVAAAGTAAPATAAAVAEARAHIEQAVTAAARLLLGEATAATWLAPLWRALAARAAALPFRAANEHSHAAALWLCAGDAAAAAQAVEGIESWRRIPAPLAWMVQARMRSGGLDAVWPLLAELAWLAPARFAALAQQLADPLLDRLLRRFGAEFEAGISADHSHPAEPLAWFPAWVLTDQPALAARLREAQPGLDTEPERALRLMVELLGLERQGRHHELIERRRRLRDLQPALFAAYMKTR